MPLAGGVTRDGGLKEHLERTDATAMTMPFLPSDQQPPTQPPTTPPPGETASRRPSVEHIVLGAVLIAVVLGAAGWFLLKPGSSSSAAKPLVRPAVTMVATPAPTTSAPAVAKKPAKRTAAQTKYFVAAEAVCTKETKVQKALSDPAANAASEVAYLHKVEALGKAEIAHLAKLKEPAGWRSKLKEIDAINVQGLAALNHYIAAVKDGKAAAAATYEKALTTLSDKSDALYDSLGMKACGSGSG